MIFRQAVNTDIDLLVQLRKTQLIDEGLPCVPDITDQLHDFFQTQLANGHFIQWLAYDNDKIAATGAIIFYAFPPSNWNPTGLRGYIANMYTVPAYRGKGLAGNILDLLVQEARDRQVTKLFLYGSEMGKPVYTKYGFQLADAYMEYDIK